MRHVVETHDLQQLLRTTAMPSRTFPRSELSIPPVLIRRSRISGRVPSVSNRQRGRWKELLKVPLIPPQIEELEVAGPRLSSTRVPVMSGFTLIGSCNASHGPYSGMYFGSQPGGNPACGVGFNPEMSFEAAYKAACAVTSSSGIVQVLSTMNGIILPSKRRRETWQRPAGTVSKLAQTMVAPGERRGAQRSNRQMDSTLRRRARDRYQPGYRRKATQITVMAGRRGEIVRDGPPTAVSHRDVPTSERKTLPKLGALIGAYHKLTEINDLVDSLAGAIPDGRCDNLPGFAKLVCVVNNWDEIDPFNATVNVLVNEIEDRIVGRLQGQLSDALKRAGGPNSTQVQQFVRQLRMMGVI